MAYMVYPHLFILDEWHEAQTPELYDTMRTGMVSRRQPLCLIITTAGVDTGGPCRDRWRQLEKILNGQAEDETTLCFMYTLDDGDDWTTPENLAKANPNLGVSVIKSDLEAKQKIAIGNTNEQNQFKVKHLDIWAGSSQGFYNITRWLACGDPAMSPDDFLGDGYTWHIGCDMSVSEDATAVVLLASKPTDDERGINYKMFPYIWLPEDAIETSKNRTRYETWAKDGHLFTFQGGEIIHADVADFVIALAKKYAVAGIGSDPKNATGFMQRVKDGVEGVSEVYDFKVQGGNASDPFKESGAAINAGRMVHTGNPMMEWMAGNTIGKVGNFNTSFIFPSKPNEDQKIDGISALIAAIDGATRGIGVQTKSKYETQGMLIM